MRERKKERERAVKKKAGSDREESAEKCRECTKGPLSLNMSLKAKTCRWRQISREVRLVMTAADKFGREGQIRQIESALFGKGKLNPWGVKSGMTAPRP